MSEHKGCLKINVFVPIMLALGGLTAASFGYTTTRAEAVRLEMKQDLEKMETRIIQAVRETKPR